MFPKCSKSDSKSFNAWNNLKDKAQKQWATQSLDEDLTENIHRWHIPSSGQKNEHREFLHALNTCWNISLLPCWKRTTIQETHVQTFEPCIAMQNISPEMPDLLCG